MESLAVGVQPDDFEEPADPVSVSNEVSVEVRRRSDVIQKTLRYAMYPYSKHIKRA